MNEVNISRYVWNVFVEFVSGIPNLGKLVNVFV